ncbi:MAG: hypothetical protein WCI67_08915 [Chloroflexales bacterium]
MNSQLHTLRPIVGREPWGAAQSPSVCCEILPVTLLAGQIYHLRRCGDGIGATWHEPLASAHPSEAVRAHLEAFLGIALDPRASVVHSTAWRYVCDGSAGGQLILTYLAVLAPGCHQEVTRSAGLIALEHVGPAQPARSETLMPPAQIGPAHVLAHALDHLSLLMETDAAIQAALGEAWRAALRRRLPRPAGELRAA